MPVLWEFEDIKEATKDYKQNYQNVFVYPQKDRSSNFSYNENIVIPNDFNKFVEKSFND